MLSLAENNSIIKERVQFKQGIRNKKNKEKQF